jgi:general secretion pathway protein F
MPPLSLALRARVFAELALMEAAGFPAVRAFETLRATPEAALSAACAAMIKALQRGLPLATAGQQAGLFSALDGVLVAAGSEGGQLEAIYRRLAQRYLDLANHRRRVRSQLALPLAVMTLGIFISPLPALARDELGDGPRGEHARNARQQRRLRGERTEGLRGDQQAPELLRQHQPRMRRRHDR